MIDQIIARGKVEGAGVTAVFEFQNMFGVQGRALEVGDIPHVLVRHHVSLGLVPDVGVTGGAHHDGAPGAGHVGQDIVMGGGQATRATGVEGLLVTQAILHLLYSGLPPDLVLVLDSLKMLCKP